METQGLEAEVNGGRTPRVEERLFYKRGSPEDLQQSSAIL